MNDADKAMKEVAKAAKRYLRALARVEKAALKLAALQAKRGTIH